MQVACSTLAFRKYGLKEALERAKALGFDTVELCATPHHSDPQQWEMERGELSAWVRRLGLKVSSVHVPLKGPSPLSLVEKIQEEMKQSFQAIDTAVLLEAEFVVQHLELVSDQFHADEEDRLRHSVPNLEEVLRRAREEKVRVAVENVPSAPFPMFGSSAEEIVSLLQRVPPESGGLCLDLTHCLASGLDPIEILERIDPSRLISIHASDNLSVPGADRHLPIGGGTIPWKRLFDQLRCIGFCGPFVIEVFDEKALADSLRYLSSLHLWDLGGVSRQGSSGSDCSPGKGGENRERTEVGG